MKVGDLVWSLAINHRGKKKKRLAIIVVIDYDDYTPYIIQLDAWGKQGRTSRKYLEPTD